VKPLPLFAATLFLLTGCTNTPGDTPPPPAAVQTFPPLTIRATTEDGHPGGIRVAIQTTTDTDTTTTFKIISTYEGKPAGLIVVVRRKDGQIAGGKACFKSLGAPSDLFLHVLATEYRQHLDSSARFVDSISFINWPLNDLLFDSAGQVKPDSWIAADNKLFFNPESKTGDDYAEMFMNIRAKDQWIEFVEKDADYRPALIKLLTRH